MEIGTAIKHLRKNKGLTQKVLAEMCDVSANAMNQIENNTSFPHKNTIDKINSINNSSHVEALALYCNSKLTDLGKCPTFPYYFGWSWFGWQC